MVVDCSIKYQYEFAPTAFDHRAPPRSLLSNHNTNRRLCYVTCIMDLSHCDRADALLKTPLRVTFEGVVLWECLLPLEVMMIEREPLEAGAGEGFRARLRGPSWPIRAHAPSKTTKTRCSYINAITFFNLERGKYADPFVTTLKTLALDNLAGQCHAAQHPPTRFSHAGGNNEGCLQLYCPLNREANT